MSSPRQLLYMENGALASASLARTMGSNPANDIAIPQGLSGACEEAAALYAVGKSKEAEQRLTSELNVKKGVCPRSVWYMLLDIYQATGQHSAFEKLALFFAKIFDVSPPSWMETPQAPPGFGRNVLIVEGAPKDIHKEKIRDFLLAAKSLHQARLDLSRARMDGSVEDRSASASRLLDILRALRKKKIPILLMGENQILSDLRSHLRGPEASRDPLWLLLFELLQWRGQEDTFEDLAVEYAQRFDCCAPGYETDGAIAVSPGSSSVSTSVVGQWKEDGNTIMAPPVISESESEDLLARIEHHLRETGSVCIDATNLKQMDYEAASALGRFLGIAGRPKDNVVFLRPSELITVLLQIVGAEPFVRVEPRKR